MSNLIINIFRYKQSQKTRFTKTLIPRTKQTKTNDYHRRTQTSASLQTTSSVTAKRRVREVEGNNGATRAGRGPDQTNPTPRPNPTPLPTPPTRTTPMHTTTKSRMSSNSIKVSFCFVYLYLFTPDFMKMIAYVSVCLLKNYVLLIHLSCN